MIRFAGKVASRRQDIATGADDLRRDHSVRIGTNHILAIRGSDHRNAADYDHFILHTFHSHEKHVTKNDENARRR